MPSVHRMSKWFSVSSICLFCISFFFSSLMLLPFRCSTACSSPSVILMTSNEPTSRSQMSCRDSFYLLRPCGVLMFDTRVLWEKMRIHLTTDAHWIHFFSFFLYGLFLYFLLFSFCFHWWGRKINGWTMAMSVMLPNADNICFEVVNVRDKGDD